MKKFLALALALCMVLALCACGSSSTGSSAPAATAAPAESTEAAAPAEAEAEAEDVVVIGLGLMGPLTGPYAQYGEGAANGAEIAVNEINAMGGKYQFVFYREDDQGDPELAVNAYNTLMDKDVKIIVGAVTSGACMAVAEVANEERVFCLTPSASNDLVPESGNQIYQICFTDSNQGAVSAAWVAEHRPEAKVGIIYNNAQDYSMGIRQSFLTKAAELGIEVVAESAFSDDTATDFSVQVSAMKDAGADFVFLPMYYTPALSILTQADAAEYHPEYFGVDGMDGVLGVEGLNVDLVQGVCMLTGFDGSDPAEAVQNYVSSYKSLYNDTPNQFSADAYDAVYVLAAALEQAGITADDSAADICEKLIDTLQSLGFDGITGSMTWSADGTVTKSPLAVKIQGTEYVTAD